MTTSQIKLQAGCALMSLALCAGAHELQDNRATLVQRDTRHVSLQLYVGLPDVMHQVLAPKRPFPEFVMAMTAVAPPEFAAAALAMQKKIEQEMRVVDDKGTAMMLSNWAWPAPTQLQAALRERAMELAVAPADHSLAMPIEVRAELRSSTPIRALQVQFPASLKRVMLVYYRPKQVWAGSAKPSPLLTFGDAIP